MVDVEIDNGHARGAMVLTRIECGDGGVVKEAKAHGAVVFGVVARWTKGAEGVVGLAAKHRINGRCCPADGAECRLKRMGRHDGVGVEIFQPLLRCHGVDSVDMFLGMGKAQVLIRAEGCMISHEATKRWCIEHGIHGLQAVAAFGVAGWCFMGK